MIGSVAIRQMLGKNQISIELSFGLKC